MAFTSDLIPILFCKLLQNICVVFAPSPFFVCFSGTCRRLCQHRCTPDCDFSCCIVPSHPARIPQPLPRPALPVECCASYCPRSCFPECSLICCKPQQVSLPTVPAPMMPAPIMPRNLLRSALPAAPRLAIRSVLHRTVTRLRSQQYHLPFPRGGAHKAGARNHAIQNVHPIVVRQHKAPLSLLRCLLIRLSLLPLLLLPHLPYLR